MLQEFLKRVCSSTDESPPQLRSKSIYLDYSKLDDYVNNAGESNHSDLIKFLDGSLSFINDENNKQHMDCLIHIQIFEILKSLADLMQNNLDIS